MKNKKDQRDGHGIRWTMPGRWGGQITGFSIDNLNTKEPPDAENCFEELFIHIRKTLENYSSCCLDEEEERLNVCQAVSDEIKRKFKIKSRKAF